MVSEKYLEAVNNLIEIEEERRGYRDPVEFLKEKGFPEKVGELLEVDLDELESQGLLTSRYVNAEATIRDGEAIDHEFREVKYYSFTEKLVEELDYSFEKENEVSSEEKDFLEVLEKVEENSPTRGVPVSVLQALKPGKDGLEVEESFEDPLSLLESVNRKGLVRIESESRGRLSRDFFYSDRLGEDVFTLSVVDRVHLSG